MATKRGQIWDPTLLSLPEPRGSDISSSLYPTPEVSHSGAHFHLCQTCWALLGPPNPLALPTWDWSHLRGPQCQPPAQGPTLGGRWAAGKHSWDLGSSEPALRGGGRGLLDTPAGAGATCGVCPQPSLHLPHLCPPDPVPGPVGAALALSPGNVSLHGHSM